MEQFVVMISSMHSTRFLQVSHIILLWVLSYTGMSKWVNLSHFKSSMRSQPIPELWADVFTYLIPTLETIAVIGLILPALKQKAWILTTVLMTAFTAYVLYIILTGLHNTTCPCGGLFENLSWNQHLFVNIGLTILSFGTLYVMNSQQRIPGHGKRRNADASDQTK